MVNQNKQSTEPAKGAARSYRYLLLYSIILIAALVCLCVLLADRCQAEKAGEARLSAQLSVQQEELEQLQIRVTQQQAALDEAQEIIRHEEENQILPEYTQLYPELYAQPWEGETAAGEQVVYLTFDDGPSANTDQVLSILEQYGIQATFFVVGKTSEQDQQRLRDIVSAGHTLAIHSWTHDYNKIYASVEAYLEDFNTLYEWIYEVTGTHPQIFRFPGGSINSYNRGIYQEIIAEMTRRGFLYYDWNASAQDAVAKPLASSVIAENCLKGIGRKQVVLLSHDSAACTTTVQALPSVIEGYQKAGYTFAPLTPGVTPVIMGYPNPASTA